MYRTPPEDLSITVVGFSDEAVRNIKMKNDPCLSKRTSLL